MSEMKLRPPKNRASAVQQHGPQVVRVSLREFKGAQARVPVLLDPGFPKDIMANYTTTLQDGVRPDANFDDARAVGAAAAPQRGAQVEADGSRSEPQAVSDGGLPLPQNLGPNNERLEDAAPRLVNALRELVVQYRQEGHRRAAARNPAHPPGAPVLAGLAVCLVESAGHDLASAVGSEDLR